MSTLIYLVHSIQVVITMVFSRRSAGYMALLAILIVVFGCSTFLTGGGYTIFETTESSYVAETSVWEDEDSGDFGEFVKFTLEFSFKNMLDDSVFVIGCGGPSKPHIQKWEGNRWRTVFGFLELLCLDTRLEFEPGETYQQEITVIGSLGERHGYPRFKTDEIEGEYRLVWRVYKTSDHRDLIAMEHRVSSSFNLTVSE